MVAPLRCVKIEMRYPTHTTEDRLSGRNDVVLVEMPLACFINMEQIRFGLGLHILSLDLIGLE
jgi:hypothetical protein